MVFKFKIEPEVYNEIKEEIIIRSIINTYKNPDTTWIS
jgi:hypothetical protein